MPEMDGFEVCQQLKANPRDRRRPIIFISALDKMQNKIRAFSAGGVNYITKPFQLEEVIARVETHLALRRLQRNLEAPTSGSAASWPWPPRYRPASCSESYQTCPAGSSR